MVSPGVFADLAAQRACWHPVAFAKDVAERPVHADLLGEPLVVWRGAGGAPRVMSDLCVHRGTALSLGSVSGDELVCPYHGWRYGADGRCTAIPQKEDPAVVPAKARLRAFGAQERYGLIWVALEEPRWPLPEVPELEAGGWAVVSAGPYRWRCDAARQVENFTDFGHFPWVHPGLLGDPERPVVPRHEVQADDHVLRYEIVRPEAPNSDDFPVFGNQQAGPLVPEGFRPNPPGEALWRTRLAGRGPAVVISTGAWGAGSGFEQTAGILHEAGYRPVVLCGNDVRLRRRLADAVPAATALGWVEDMPGLLAASAAVLDNAAGQTALQALAVGVPVIGWRPIPGHGAAGVRQMAQLGLTDHATTADELVRLLAERNSPASASTSSSARAQPWAPTAGDEAGRKRGEAVRELMDADVVGPLESMLDGRLTLW